MPTTSAELQRALALTQLSRRFPDVGGDVLVSWLDRHHGHAGKAIAEIHIQLSQNSRRDTKLELKLWFI